MWIYTQSTGELRYGTLTAPVIETGYAGKGEGKNSTAHEQIRNVGPLPRGLWQMGGAYTDKKRGVDVIPLFADKHTELYGRSGFLVHGDKAGAPGTASEGCIILGAKTRRRLALSPDRWLVVV